MAKHKKKTKAKWKRIEIRCLKQLIQDGFSFELIQEYLNKYSIRQIKRQAKKLDLEHSKEWKDHELQVLKHGLNIGLSFTQIKKVYLSHRDVATLKDEANKNGWKASSSNQCLLSFHINRIPLSFTAGFIQADGSFSRSGGVDIGIARKDRPLLEWACDQLQIPRSKIFDTVKKSNSKSNKTYPTSRLYLPKALGDSFVKHFRLSPQKSKGQVVFPSFLNEYCLKAYLLGLFYGDGCHSKSRGRSRIDFVSSYGFLKELLHYMQKNKIAKHFTENNIKRIPTKTPGYDLARLRLHGKDAIRFFHFLTAEPEMMQQLPNLDRKIQDILTCDLPREKKR